ncbi:MAG TPA: flagellar basal body rod protein FlgB [Desulfuromonadales bacterium]|nr:flagellar basal body rod protein FlgB [Desulfuromonadales bacterium]
MSTVGLFDQTITLMQKVMDLRLENQQAIASNIANADTPGYVPDHLEFDQQLQQALSNEETQSTGDTPGNPAFFPIDGAGGIEAVQPKVVKDAQQSLAGDGNGVAVDQEMVDLSKNEILYEAATKVLSKKFGLLKYVVQGGK